MKNKEYVSWQEKAKAGWWWVKNKAISCWDGAASFSLTQWLAILFTMGLAAVLVSFVADAYKNHRVSRMYQFEVERPVLIRPTDQVTRVNPPVSLSAIPKTTEIIFAPAPEVTMGRVGLLKPNAGGTIEAFALNGEDASRLLKEDIASERRRIREVPLYQLSEDQVERLQLLALALSGEKSSFHSKEIKRVALQVLPTFVMLCLMLVLMSRMTQRKDVKFTPPRDIKGNLSDLIGMEDIKEDVLRLRKFFSQRELFSSYGVTKPHNILFSGPPGTGKTKLAGFLAKELNLPILFQSAANLETGYVNGGSQTLDLALRKAKRLGRCIIFLDEAQDLFVKRGQSGRKFDDDTQNTLLSLLDGVRTKSDAEIIWIVASNFNQENLSMDEAMLRRFPMKIDFRLPNADERAAIFDHYLSKVDVAQRDPNLELTSLVHVTEHRSPADIETIVYEAGMAALHAQKPIDGVDLMSAAERVIMGNNDVQTTKGMEREREIIAIHEVGHFLMDFVGVGGTLEDPLAVKDKIGTLKISLKANARKGALGFVFKKPGSGFLSTRNDVEVRVRGLYGGTANEELFFGKEGQSDGASNDIQEATKLIYHATVTARLYDHSKLNLAVLKSKHAGDVPLTDEDKQKMQDLSATLYEETLHGLTPLKPISKKLSELLQSEIELSGEQFLSAMAPAKPN